MSELRVLYIAGPGDAKAAFHSWAKGGVFSDNIAYGYSHQLYDVCKELGVPLLALTTHINPSYASVGDIAVENIEDVFSGKHGLGYHAAHFRYAALLVRQIRRFRANLTILAAEPYAFLLPILRAMGVRVVYAYHCSPWPYFEKKNTKANALFLCQKLFYRHNVYAALSISNMISEQVRELAGGDTVPILEFFPKLREDVFEDMSPPNRLQRPFRFTFVGRAEENKGVFDLVEIARRFKAMGRTDIVIDLCGTGAATPRLEEMVKKEGLENWLVLHGWCTADKLKEIHAKSHAAVMPSHTNALEGFPKTLVEALLSGRPVVTSRACPNVEYMESGLCIAIPNDVESYFEAMLVLVDDQNRYDELRSGSRAAGEKCFGDEHSFATVVRQLLVAAREGRTPQSHSTPRVRNFA